MRIAIGMIATRRIGAYESSTDANCGVAATGAVRSACVTVRSVPGAGVGVHNAQRVPLQHALAVSAPVRVSIRHSACAHSRAKCALLAARASGARHNNAEMRAPVSMRTLRRDLI